MCGPAGGPTRSRPTARCAGCGGRSGWRRTSRAPRRRRRRTRHRRTGQSPRSTPRQSSRPAPARLNPNDPTHHVLGLFGTEVVMPSPLPCPKPSRGAAVTITDAPKIVTRRLSYPDSHTMSRYLATDGYTALRKGLTMPREEIQDEVNKCSLLGRGGAGFPAGRKWSMLRKAEPVYLVVNGDESEPATFKDHMLIEGDPHQIVEGTLITAYAVNAA